MLNAVLLDDEQEAVTGLSLKLSMACPEVAIAQTFTEPLKAITYLHDNPPDVLFLDIEMPVLNGFGLLDALPERRFDVIMVTAYSEHAIKALKARAVDYLMKPVDVDELREAVNKVILRKDKERETDTRIEELSRLMRKENPMGGRLALHGAREMHLVHLAQIIRVEGENNYSIFFLANGQKITVTKTLKDYEAQLADHGFFRVHKSHLVNLSYLVKVNRADCTSVVMSDSAEIEISVRRKADFLKALEGLVSP